MNRLILWSQRLALTLLLVYPLSLAWLAQADEIRSFPSAYQALMLAPLFLVLVGFLIRLFLARPNHSDGLAAGLVVLLAVALRLSLGMILSSDLSSDVLDTHRFALDVLAGDVTAHTDQYTYIPEVPYLNMNGLALAGVYALFGASVKTAKLFMVALSGLTCALIYLAGKQLSGDYRVGLTAALLFAVWPALICFSGIPSGEHLAMFLLMAAVLGWSWFSRGEAQLKGVGRIALYAGLGALIGLLDWFRPIGSALLTAFGLAEFFSLQPGVKLLARLGSILALAVGFFTVAGLSVRITESMHQIDLPASSQQFGGQLLIGSNVEKLGRHNWADHGEIVAAFQRFPGDPSAANRYLLNLAFERMAENRDRLPGLLVEKFRRVWGNEEQLFTAALIGSNDQELVGALAILNQYLLLFVVSLAIAASLHGLLRQPPSKQIFMMQLSILGLALLLTVTEAQMRYRAFLAPFLAILAGMGLKAVIAAGKMLIATIYMKGDKL